MKKILLYAASIAISGLFFVGCQPLGGADEFNEAFLYSGSGEWVSTQDFGDGPEEMHDKFLADGTGSSWSATQGTPPQAFNWSLKGETLTFIHDISAGGAVPIDYTVVTLTETRLVYKDQRSGDTISCTKK